MDLSINSIESLREITDGPARRIVIVSHTNPDGDAIGSSLAWGEYLETKGHHITCVVPNRFPSFLGWMTGIDKLRIFKDDADGSTAKAIAEAEVVFCMDFNLVARLEGLGETILANDKARFVLIDHHLDPPTDYDISLSYPDCSSTSFLVYKIIEAISGTDAITLPMGESLYVGMMTDTGNFAFSNLTADLFTAVAELVRKGVDIPSIHTRVYNSFTAERVKLLGYALNKMEILRPAGVGVAYITLTEAELRRFRFQQGDSEGFVNYPLSIRDLSMSAIFIETNRFIRISLRSRGDVDVSRFARLYFEGGGHRNASGGKSYRPMAETVRYFRKCVKEYFEGEAKEHLEQVEKPEA